MKKISLVLAIIMIAAVLFTVPFSASAEEVADPNNCILVLDGVNYGKMPFDAVVDSVVALSGKEAVVYLTDDVLIEKGVALTFNLTIEGCGHVISIKEGLGNVFMLNSENVTLTINQATLTGDAAGPNNASSCIFQLKGVNTTLNLNDVTMNALKARWYIVNLMGNDGLTRTVNLTRVKALNAVEATNGFLSGGNANNPNAEKNPTWDHTNYCVINIKDSAIAHAKRVIQFNAGTTGEIKVENSTLQILDGAADGCCAVKLGNAKNLAEGQKDTISFVATGSLIKVPTNCMEVKYDDPKDAAIVFTYTPGVPTEVTGPAIVTPPAVDTPTTEAPVVTTEAPVVTTDAPVVTTDAPATDAPATDAPATDAPATDAPAPAGGCGGFSVAAQLVALICAAAAFIVIKKK